MYIFSSNTSLRIKPIFKHVIRLENIYLLYSIFILHLVRKTVKKQILVYKFCGKKFPKNNDQTLAHGKKRVYFQNLVSWLR